MSPHAEQSGIPFLYYTRSTASRSGDLDLMRIQADGRGEPLLVAHVAHACGALNQASYRSVVVRVVLSGGYCNQPPQAPYSAAIIKELVTSKTASTIARNLGFVSGLSVDDRYVYWHQSGSSTIGRATLDGRSITARWLSLPRSSALGPITAQNGKVYFATCSYARITIGEARADGSIINRKLVSSRSTPIPGICLTSLAVNDTHVYWAATSDEHRATYIGRASLDGSDVQPEWLNTHTWITGWIAADDSHLFWSWGAHSAYTGRVDLRTRVLTQRFTLGGGILSVSG